MIRIVLNKVLPRIVRRTVFPLMSKEVFINLWKLSTTRFFHLKGREILMIIRHISKFDNIVTLLSIPLIYEIFSVSLETTDKKKIFKEIGTASVDVFIWVLIVYTLFLRAITKFFKLMWLPVKVSLFLYLCYLGGFNIETLFTILNNISLGILNWFYRLVNDFFFKLFGLKKDDNTLDEED